MCPLLHTKCEGSIVAVRRSSKTIINSAGFSLQKICPGVEIKKLVEFTKHLKELMLGGLLLSPPACHSTFGLG